MAGSRLGSAARLSSVALIVSFALVPLPAHAAFPGANGKIALAGVSTINPDGTGQSTLLPGSYPAWSADGTKIAFVSNRDGNDEIYTMNADGSGPARLTNNPASDLRPSWSPDGQKIAFESARTGDIDVYTMNADGSNQTNITNLPGVADGSPAWSPDGQKIAFTSNRDVSYSDIYTMGADGQLPTRVTFSPSFSDGDPNWSPDGRKITFAEDTDNEGGYDIFTMNADGSSKTDLTNNAGGWHHPAWSPDGHQISADNWNFEVWVMDAACCGGFVYLTQGSSPDWQPLPTTSYPHPQSASQLQVSLVPAFRQCGTGGNPSNAKHSPPLATDSCNPPRPGSVLAAVGTASQSSAQMTVVPGDTDPTNGNQANVPITVSLSDIRATAGGDYNPNPSGADLTAVTRLRFTDKANGYGGLPATATEYDFKIPIDCSSTADPSVGSTCSANTTANSLVPGLIQEQRQTIVQAFRVRVDDSGANGVRGDSDDRIFMTQGVFVP